jgi:hypothetical protein
MQPQGTGVFNTTYITDLTDEINSINGCAELQLVVNEAAAQLQVELTAIRAQIATLLPLVTLPTSLGSVISWITSFASPLIQEYEHYIAELSAALSAITALEAAIANAARNLTNCTITIPPMV